MVGYIYLITDTTNGMKYVGQHHYNKEGELDPNYHGSGIIISRIYKERPETLKEEYIKTCYSDSEMNDDEKYYIKLYKTLYPNGYNLSEGGDGVLPSEESRRKMSKSHKGQVPPNKGIPMSEEQKKKLSESHKGIQAGEKHPMFGKHHSEETRKKISENHWDCSGEKHPFFGKHHTEESKKKISEKQKGKKLSEETRRKMSKARINGKQSKKILQFTLDGVFVREWSSIAECERNGYNRANICYCCQGKRKSHKGFKWCYA